MEDYIGVRNVSIQPGGIIIGMEESRIPTTKVECELKVNNFDKCVSGVQYVRTRQGKYFMEKCQVLYGKECLKLSCDHYWYDG